MTEEIRYVGFVQVAGLIGPESVVSAGFSSTRDAVAWVRDMVEEAHGEVALVCPTVTSFRFDFGGEPHKEMRNLWFVISSGGPTWGAVMEAGVDLNYDDEMIVD